MSVHRHKKISNSKVKLLHVSNHMVMHTKNYATPFMLFPLYQMKKTDVTERTFY